MIPGVLLYIVPGFFVLMIIEAFTQRKKQAPMETILWSIFFSFLVEVALFPINLLWNLSQVSLTDLSGTSIDSIAQKPFPIAISIALSVLLAGLLGFILVKLIDSKLGRWVVRKLNFNLEPGGDFWFETLKSKEGDWAIVYMKNGMVYRGQLITYTTDPNDPMKMLTLTNICTMVPKTSAEIEKECSSRQPCKNEHYRIVRNEAKKDNVKVLLKFEDILSIEIGS